MCIPCDNTRNWLLSGGKCLELLINALCSIIYAHVCIQCTFHQSPFGEHQSISAALSGSVHGQE